jgi:hypothetical protein
LNIPLQTTPAITAHTRIYRNKIFRNGQCIFEKPGSAESFLDESYAYLHIVYPKFYKMDKLCKLGFLAAEILLEGSGHGKKYSESDTGLILSNTHGSLDIDLKYVKTIPAGASPALFVYTLPNIVIGEISIRHHFKGENAFFVFKHFDGNFIAAYVKSLFENNLVQAAICGWVDILEEEYDARLFLIEKNMTDTGISFTADNLYQLNEQKHG